MGIVRLIALQVAIALAVLIQHVACYKPAPHELTPALRKAGIRKAGYITEPSFKPQKFGIEYFDGGESSVSPGYIFLADMVPVGSAGGPQIFTTSGELVWFGRFSSTYRVQDFKVCALQGNSGESPTDKHLCWTEREVNHTKSAGSIAHKIFMKADYTLLKNFTDRGDVHEFHVVDNGRAFVTMDYKIVSWDLSPHGPKDGAIRDACILEYDISTWSKAFEWCYSDNLSLWDTFIYYHVRGQKNTTSNISGSGTKASPWDFAHVNSVDKNADGDYIASIRHLDQVIKIAGSQSASGEEPGTVLWRLGGKSNEFDMELNFSRQHDAKYVETGRSESLISLFDNAWEGINEPSAKSSSGKLIRIKNSTMQADLVHEYVHPYGGLSQGRGSMQLLNNGNVFVGWGKIPEFTEFSADAKPLYHVRFAGTKSKQFSYRAFRFPWVGKPLWDPKMVPYKYSCVEGNSPLYVYVSWNGATEVRKWHLHTSYSEAGPWLSAGTFIKDGFETRIQLDSSAAYVWAEALDENDEILGSIQRKTFVPHQSLRPKCNEFRCPNHFDYEDEASRGEECQRLYVPAFAPFVLVLIFLEMATFLIQSLAYRIVWGKNKSWLTSADEAGLTSGSKFDARVPNR